MNEKHIEKGLKAYYDYITKREDIENEILTYISKRSHRDGVYEGIEIAETNFRNEIKRRRAENRKKQKKSGEE